MTYSALEEKIRIHQCQTIEAQAKTIQKRKLGSLKGKASVKFADDFAIIDAFIDGLMIQHQMKKHPSDELTAAIKESEAMLNDPNTKKFDSVDALFADLDAEE